MALLSARIASLAEGLRQRVNFPSFKVMIRMTSVRTLVHGLFIFLCIGVGLYPLMYALVDMRGGLLNSKPEELLINALWRSAFNIHIALGGLALLIGWSQFITRLRDGWTALHRLIGKLYVVSVLVSGTMALCISPFASAGPVAALGFGTLAMLWLFTTTRAYLAIRARRIEPHRRSMIRSYALTFAAVTLRIWLPLMQFGMGIHFDHAYRVVAWLCWVPNLLVAEAWIRRWARPASAL